MSASRALLVPIGLLLATACTPKGGATDSKVAALKGQLDSLEAEVTALQTELAEVKERLPASREDRLAERRERRRELGERERTPLPSRGTPDLRDPFGDNGRKPKADGPPTPLPLPSTRVSTDDATAIMTRLVESVQCEVGSCTLSSKELTEALGNPAALAKQARVVPSMRDGVTDGFKFYGIRPRSLPKAIGLKNGDKLRAINDEPLDSMDQAMAMYTKLRDAKSITLLLERKGKLHTLELNFK